jgi:hypothetical protein
MPILGIIASGQQGVNAIGDYESIATNTLGADASSITFSSIPSTYTHLQIRYIAKGNNAGDLEFLGFRFNGFTGDYYWHQIFGNGTTGTATNFQQSFMRTFIQGSDGTNVFGVGVADVLDYRSTSKNKTLRMLGGANNNGTGYASLSSGLWTDTSAINSITILGVNNTLKAGSSFALYGII